MFSICLSYCASHILLMLVSQLLVVVCFRIFMHNVEIAFSCAMLKVEDQILD